MNSVRYALEQFGINETDPEVLRRFVGPPLVDSFQSIYGMDRKTADQAVAVYREKFSGDGIFENRLYPGIPKLLEELKNSGAVLAIASSKPEPYVLKILDHFGISSLFSEVVGSLMNGDRNSKPEVVEEALFRLKAENDREQVLMIGDSEYDVLGAREQGLDCVAVTYGYGDPEQIKDAGPVMIVETVEELSELLQSLLLQKSPE